MNGIILDVYFGSQLAEDLTNNAAISRWLSINNIIYLGVFVFFVLMITLLVFVIMPKIMKNPERYFKRYLVVRNELGKIDELYAKKKMTFQDYSFAQFHYAKEYEQIVAYLSDFPEYKVKLKSYRLNAVKQRDIDNEERLTAQQKKNQDVINYFVEILTAQAPYYRKSEIQQALLDEGYSRDVAEGVTDKLEAQGVVFNSLEKEDNRRAIELVDSILERKLKPKETKSSWLDRNKKETPIALEKPKPVIVQAPPKPEITDVPKPKPVIVQAPPKPEITDMPKPKPIIVQEPPKQKPITEQPKVVTITETPKIQPIGPTSINLKELAAPKKPGYNFGEDKTTFAKYSDYKLVTNKKKTFFGSLFEPKEKHTISEINDVFKDIEKKLKEEEKK